MTLPIHLHSHATSGLAELCQLKAIENGCRHIETAFTAFAGGASHSHCESRVATLRGTASETGLDLGLLQDINAQLREIRKKYQQFESEFAGVDSRVQFYQIPGGAAGAIKGGGKEGVRPTASKPGHVRVSMPCVAVEVKVVEGDRVAAGTPVLVTEAMKMESEIHAPLSGRVTHVYVAKGDRAMPGEALIEIEA